MSMVTSYPSSTSLHRSTHLAAIGATFPHVLPVIPGLPYNKPSSLKGRCSTAAASTAASSAAVAVVTVPQATPASALTALSASRDRDRGSGNEGRPRKRHFAMSMVFPPPQHLLREGYDLNKVGDTLRQLNLAGYYYDNLSWQQADGILKSTDVGSFLVRNSQDNRFLFALSVQTERGPTSIRIHYNHGAFRLDGDHYVAVDMPSFPCVVELVEYYISLSRSDKAKCCVWVDGSGRRDLPIKILKPIYRKVNPLQHLCRLAFNNAARSTNGTLISPKKIPDSLKIYLEQYPHKH